MIESKTERIATSFICASFSLRINSIYEVNQNLKLKIYIPIANWESDSILIFSFYSSSPNISRSVGNN